MRPIGAKEIRYGVKRPEIEHSQDLHLTDREARIVRVHLGEVGVRELRQNLSVYLKRVKEGATLEVKERDHRVAVLAPVGAHSSALDRLIAAGRATPARSDLLDLGPPLGQRPTRRASRALSRLRDETRRA